MNRSFIQTLQKDTYDELSAVAKERGISIQRLIEGVIIFDWKKRNQKSMPSYNPNNPQQGSHP